MQHRCNIVALSLQNPRTANIISKATQAMVTATLLFRYIFVTKIRSTSRPAVKSRPSRRHSAQIPPRPLLSSACCLRGCGGAPVVAHPITTHVTFYKTCRPFCPNGHVKVIRLSAVWAPRKPPPGGNQARFTRSPVVHSPMVLRETSLRPRAS